MASLRELLSDDGFRKRAPEPRPHQAKLLQRFADHGESKFCNRAVSMPLMFHHGGAHGTATLLLPSADHRPSWPGEEKTSTGANTSQLPRRKIPPANISSEDEDDVEDMPARFGGSGNLSSTAGTTLPLDEAATRALVSILNDYIGSFFKDENFRLGLRQKCFFCVRFRENCNGGEEEYYDELTDHGGAKEQLGDAIKVIERSVVDRADLRRCHAQLTGIITGSSTCSNDHSSGGGGGGGLMSSQVISRPRSRLSACAHLYLSVVCKMAKKPAASAKHLLQVFCDAPFEARTILLSDLWGSLLLPHLRHLRAWYVEEAEGAAVSGSSTPCRGIKMKLLKRVYGDALDKGTRQIAAYYRGWVAGRGLEADPPRYPSICVPSPSRSFVASKGSSGQFLGIASPRSDPAFSSGPSPLISRKLYESIFSRSTVEQ